MDGEKSLILGCDSTEDLSAVLKSLKASTHFSCSVITTNRISDVIGISRSVSCDLIILFFHNNQDALAQFFAAAPQNEIPILCVTAQMSGTFTWPPGKIVFTYPARDIYLTDYFNSAIHSILLLRKNTGTLVSQKHYNHSTKTSSPYSDDLSRYVMELDHKTEVLSKVKERISDLYPRVDDSTRSVLNSIVNSIKMSSSDDKVWEDFRIYYEMNDPGFLLELARKHPDLTPRDLKYCCYVKMNMSNDDIRSLLGINQESVRTHKYRLKKKMLLPNELDLRSYLMNISPQ